MPIGSKVPVSPEVDTVKVSRFGAAGFDGAGDALTGAVLAGAVLAGAALAGAVLPGDVLPAGGGELVFFDTSPLHAVKANSITQLSKIANFWDFFIY